MTLNHTTVHIDFEINRSDLFRMNLDLAKWRLIIGLTVAVIPIAGLIYFFLLIEEGKILLELSPLIVGAPLIAIGAQILRLHAACRKFVSELPDRQRRFEYFFQLETDGYDLAHGDSFSHVAWKDVRQVFERATYFVFYMNSFEARLVPKTGFHAPADIPVLRSILSARLGARAKLFKS